MNVYIYQAALLCEACGEHRMHMLDEQGKRPHDPFWEPSYDSDDYPKGPFADGGGEADVPQHCDHCNAFLENPLTSAGLEYVRDQLDNYPHKVAGTLLTWVKFYGEDLLPGDDSITDETRGLILDNLS